MLTLSAGSRGSVMNLQTMILGALIVTYFASRLALRLPISLAKPWGILAAHAIALGTVALGIALWRYPLGAFSAEHLLVYLSPQVLWCLLDLLREHPVGLSRRSARSGDQAP